MTKFDLDKAKGTHVIGHTRMATESAVTTAGSHPFATGADLCLVHNGSLSNHNRLRENLKREGLEFQTENDTEVAAAYMTWKLRQGASLKQALEDGIKDLDGFYTFCVGTHDGFAVVRDPIACKHAVLAETDDWVAMATEYPRHRASAGRRRCAESGSRRRKRSITGAATHDRDRSRRKKACAGVNSRLHALPKDTNERHWLIRNPQGQHAIACGLDAPMHGRDQGPCRLLLRRHEQAGRDHRPWPCRRRRCREHDVGHRAGQRQCQSESAGATGNGGLLVIEGDASSRCGISMKGIDIVVGGSVGHMSAFMAQRGNLVVLRRCRRGAGRFDLRSAALCEAARSRASAPTASRRRCATEHRDRARDDCSSSAEIKAKPKEFRRYGSARKLYNFNIDHADAY